MAKLEAIAGGATVVLNDTTNLATTYRLREMTGFGGADVRRVTTQGPEQYGDTDVGYRLGPRDLELVIGFKASTDAALDAFRDALVSVFKPSISSPIVLKHTRDDGGIRQLDCNVRGKIDIKLDKDMRPGHYHVATIPLRAPYPPWYDPNPGTVTVVGSAGTATDWYLAGGAIGTASVLMSGGTPAQGDVWSYVGSIAHSTSWTLAMRMLKESFGTADKYAFYVDNGAVSGTSPNMDIALRAGTAEYFANGTVFYAYPLGTAFMNAAVTNYMIAHNTSGLDYDASNTPSPAIEDEYVNCTNPVVPSTFYTAYIDFSPYNRPIGGTARRWRSDATNTAASRWAGTIFLYALYSPALRYTQMQALNTFMAGSVGGTALIATPLTYSGNLPEYPVISITGPVTGAAVRNTSTEDLLSFGTFTIGAGTTYVIDTRPGVKTILQGTANKRPELSSDSNLDTWHITPDTDTGTNGIYLTGTNTSAATTLRIVYYNRYTSP